MRARCLLLTLSVATGCAFDPAALELHASEGSAQPVQPLEQALVARTSSLWPAASDGVTTVPVCFVNIDPDAYPNEVGAMRSALASTWGRFGRISFAGFQSCSSDRAAGVIKVHVDPANQPSAWIGTQAGAAEGCGSWWPWSDAHCYLRMNFDWSCGSLNRLDCIAAVTVHEFGHALGFPHEQSRGDTPATCTERQSSGEAEGDWVSGAWDWHSVMNYCAPRYNNWGQLSAGDMEGVQKLYGGAYVEAGSGLGLRAGREFVNFNAYLPPNRTTSSSSFSLSATFAGAVQVEEAGVAASPHAGVLVFGETVRLRARQGYLGVRGPVPGCGRGCLPLPASDFVVTPNPGVYSTWIVENPRGERTGEPVQYGEPVRLRLEKQVPFETRTGSRLLSAYLRSTPTSRSAGSIYVAGVGDSFQFAASTGTAGTLTRALSRVSTTPLSNLRSSGAPTPIYWHSTQDGGRMAVTHGEVADEQSTWFELETSDTYLAFDWRVSSEYFYDRLTLSVDGVEKAEISREEPWRRISFVLPPGRHVVRWTYAKDFTVSEGEDRGLVANVFTGPSEGALSHAGSGWLLGTRGWPPANDTPLVGANGGWQRFRILPSGSLQHVPTGMCVHPLGGAERPADGTPLVVHAGCDIERLAFEFTEKGSLRHRMSAQCIQMARDTGAVTLGGECDTERQELMFR